MSRPERVRFSNLKRIGQSPAHYLSGLMHGIDPTRAMKIGSATHQRVLGGDEYVVYEGDRRGKAWAEFKAAHDGALILTQPEHESASRIAGAVMANPLAADVLAGAPMREHEILWDFAGRACASHLDALATGRYVVELKVTNCAEPSRFSRQALHMGYIAQCAFYAEAAKVDAAYIIAVEDKRPWPVTVLRLTPRALSDGLKQCRAWMERLLACEAEDAWPGYCQSIVELDTTEDEEFALTFGDEEEEAA